MKVGIIGLDGHTGQIRDGIARLPEVQLVAVSDRSSRALARFSKRPVAAEAKTYRDWRTMLDRETPDVVGVCDVPSERAEVLTELARREIHIVSEKPLATSFEDLARVREAVGASRSLLTMMLTMRFQAPYLAMHEAIRAGAIGKVVLASAQKSYKIKEGSRPAWQKIRAKLGGIIPFIGCHALDLIRWTTGEEFTQVAGFSSTAGLEGWNEFEDNAVLSLKLSGGGSSEVRLDFLRPSTAPTHGDDRVRVVGSDGIIEVANADPVISQGNQPVLMTNVRGPERLPLPDPGQLFADFVTALRNGAMPRVGPEDAFIITDVCLHARHAADIGAVISL